MDERAEKIKSFYRDRGRMPSYSEVAEIIGVASKNAAFRYIAKLIDEGTIAKDSRGKLIPGDSFNSIKVLGLVEAGFPSAAEEELIDTMTLDEWLIGNKESTYMLKVKGLSMIDAGIHEGDMVLVERTSKCKTGDIVISEIDGEWTMKYLRKDKKGFYLEPANKDFPIIRPEGQMRVEAVVRSVIRKY